MEHGDPHLELPLTGVLADPWAFVKGSGGRLTAHAARDVMMPFPALQSRSEESSSVSQLSAALLLRHANSQVHKHGKGHRRRRSSWSELGF